MAQQPKKKSKGGGWFVALLLLGAGIAGVTHKSDATPPAQPSAAAATNDPRQLAAQVLQLRDDIALPDATRVALDHYAKTGEVTNFCGEKLDEVDPLLLQNLLKLQQDGFRILVNNLGIGNDREPRYCVGHDQHMLARAVDLNGIIKKGGPQTSWGGIAFRPGSEMEALQSYANAWLANLPINRGGVGQQGCNGFQVAIPPGSPNVNLEWFQDFPCNHLHLDVRIR